MSEIVLIALLIVTEMVCAYAFIRMCSHAEPRWRTLNGLLIAMIICAFIAGSLAEKALP